MASETSTRNSETGPRYSLERRDYNTPPTTTTTTSRTTTTSTGTRRGGFGNSGGVGYYPMRGGERESIFGGRRAFGSGMRPFPSLPERVARIERRREKMRRREERRQRRREERRRDRKRMKRRRRRRKKKTNDRDIGVEVSACECV